MAYMSYIRSQTLTSCRAVCPYWSAEFGSAPFVRTSFRNCRSTLKKKNHYHCVTLTNSTSCSPKVHQSGATSCFTRYLICVVIAGRQGSKVIQKPFIQLDLLLLLSIYSVFIRCKTLVFAAYIFLYKDNGLELGLILHSQQVHNNFSSVRTTLFESEYCRGPELYVWRQASLWRVQFWAIVYSK